MIKRYQNPKITKLWNEETILNLWREIEILVSEYHLQEKIITKDIYEEIKATKNNISRWKEIEATTHHHLASFVEMLSEQTKKAGKWIHFGLTSNDILDTSQNYLLYQSGKLILENLNSLISECYKKALQEKKTLCIGRTHGMHAEPTTVGYKFLMWSQELKEGKAIFNLANEAIKIVKMSGPTGIYAHNQPKLASFIAKKLKMHENILSNQITPRFYLINWTNALNNIGTTIEKIALQIRLLHQEEIQEIQENFTKFQKGSSAMPHKKNPYLSENVCGLARYLRNICQTIYSCNLLWHERDLTNSSIERITLQDVCHLMMTLILRLQKILKNLKINYKQITINLQKNHAIIFSHKLLLMLIQKTNLTRHQGYQKLQILSFQAQKNKTSLFEEIIKDPIMKKLKKEDLKKCFDVKSFLKNIDYLFKITK